jgi:hypothetical protein
MPKVLRPRLAGRLDYLALLAFLASVVIHLSGGFAVTIAGVELSAREAMRPLLVALVALGVRLLLDRTTPPPPAWRRLRNRIYDPLADEPENTPAGSRWMRYGFPLLGFCAFGTATLWAQVSRLDSIPEFGDPLFSVWRISWVYRQLMGDPRNLFDANIFHPQPLTLTYSDSMLFPALTAAPLLAAGVHPVVATNAILVLSFILSAFTVYLLVERLTGSPASAFVSGLIFGFYPYRFDHYSHFELLMTYCLPLVLLAVHRFFATCKLRYAVLAAIFATTQLYSSMYLAVLFMWQALGVCALLLLFVRPPLRRLVIPGAIAVVLALALAFPLVRTYQSARLNERSVRELALYSADVSDYGRANLRSAFWAHRTLPGPPPTERALFPGIMAIALTAIALTWRLGRTRIVYLGALVIAFEISRGSHSLLYSSLYESLSFMRGMRAPARAGFLVGLALAVLSGFGVRRLLAGRSRSASLALTAALTVAIGIDLWPNIELQHVWPTPPAIYQSVKRTDVLADFPMGLSPDTSFMTDTPHMYFSIWHGAELINGYSGHSPPGYGEFQEAMRSFPDASTIKLLRERGATHVTVNCFLYDHCRRLLTRIRRTRDLELIADTIWQDRPVRLYALRPN